MKKSYKRVTVVTLLVALAVLFANFAPAKAATEAAISKVVFPDTKLLVVVTVVMAAVILFAFFRSRNRVKASESASSQSSKGFWSDASWDGNLPPLVSLNTDSSKTTVRVIQPYSQGNHEVKEEKKKRVRASRNSSAPKDVFVP